MLGEAQAFGLRRIDVRKGAERDTVITKLLPCSDGHSLHRVIHLQGLGTYTLT